MQDVNIYIETSIHGPAKKEGSYIYILECIIDGQTKTRDGRGTLEKATENTLALTALEEAVKRIKKPCSLRVFTRCQHILNAMQNHWARQWQKNQWENAKGKPVKNAERWERVLCGLDRHLYQFTDEEHAYSGWMRDELKRERGKAT